MFGGSADSSYAGFLGPFSLPNSINDRITLIEGPPFPFDLRKVAQGFRHVSFKTIFRATKIQIATNGTTAISAGVKRSASDTLTSFRERPSAQSASAVVTPSMPPAEPTTPKPATIPALVPSPIIYQNQYGQRLDVPLTIDKEYLKNLYEKNLRLCNHYYLKGYCPHGANCEFDHSKLLSQMQIDTFRHKARTSNCRKPFCQDPLCCLGHMCPRDSSCTISQCKFLPEMHNIDVTQVYQYNTETQERNRMSMTA